MQHYPVIDVSGTTWPSLAQTRQVHRPFSIINLKKETTVLGLSMCVGAASIYSGLLDLSIYIFALWLRGSNRSDCAQWIQGVVDLSPKNDVVQAANPDAPIVSSNESLQPLVLRREEPGSAYSIHQGPRVRGVKLDSWCASLTSYPQSRLKAPTEMQSLLRFAP